MKAVLTSLFLFTSTAFAAPALNVEEAQIYAPIKGSNATAAYGVFRNSSDREIVLQVKKADSFKATELHETSEQDGRMQMKKVESIRIPAKGMFELKPGGHHIMLFDAAKNVKEGKDLSIHFDVDGKAWSTKFKVVPRTSPEEHHHHH